MLIIGLTWDGPKDYPRPVPVRWGFQTHIFICLARLAPKSVTQDMTRRYQSWVFILRLLHPFVLS